MIYKARIRKRLRYARAYTMLKKAKGQENALTRLFMRLLKQKSE